MRPIIFPAINSNKVIFGFGMHKVYLEEGKEDVNSWKVNIYLLKGISVEPDDGW